MQLYQTIEYVQAPSGGGDVDALFVAIGLAWAAGAWLRMQYPAAFVSE